MKYIKYLSILSLPFFVLISLYFGGFWSYATLLFFFGFVPSLELFTHGSVQNLSEIEEEVAKNDRVYDFILYTLVPFQFIMLFYFLNRIDDSTLLLYERIGMLSAMGIACGLSINAAHELGHRTTKYEQTMSKILLMTSLYMHFFIEHNRGHHKRVATEEDPASARYGENVYGFWFRSIVHGYLSAWDLERKRLAKKQQAFYSWNNEMLRFHLFQGLWLAIIGTFFGGMVLGCYLLAALMGILLLETVNYIEHYGLQRERLATKGYERVQVHHSWNSNHVVGRLMLFELSRHSDHHFQASRKYQILKHHEQAPQMPTGYPGMMILAHIPPLWFRVMHKKINQLA